MTISAEQRRQTEDSIRAAIDRLLQGQIPPGGACDISTPAKESGVSRAALYRTYNHLKAEFERRLAQMRADGHLPDPRAGQIVRLKNDNVHLRERLREREQQVAELTDFKTLAVSRLHAQHPSAPTSAGGRLARAMGSHHLAERQCRVDDVG